jgi:hypothetical protein
LDDEVVVSGDLEFVGRERGEDVLAVNERHLFDRTQV